jgi:hypothetical protein
MAELSGAEPSILIETCPDKLRAAANRITNRKSCGFMGIGYWFLVLGSWFLVLGIWNLEFGIWNLSKIQCQKAGNEPF